MGEGEYRDINGQEALVALTQGREVITGYGTYYIDKEAGQLMLRVGNTAVIAATEFNVFLSYDFRVRVHTKVLRP